MRHIHTYIHLYIHAHGLTWTHTNKCMHTQTYMHASKNEHTHTHREACAHTHTPAVQPTPSLHSLGSGELITSQEITVWVSHRRGIPSGGFKTEHMWPSCGPGPAAADVLAAGGQPGVRCSPARGGLSLCLWAGRQQEHRLWSRPATTTPSLLDHGPKTLLDFAL